MVESLPDWAPEGTDPSTPSVARVYDYYLGGTHHFEVDRELGRQLLALTPDVASAVRANRAFLHRAVRYLVAQGVRQFIDIGSGIPSVGNVHETAQRQAPGCRVLYVDHDPVAVAQSERMLRGNPDVQVLQGDLRSPEKVLASADLIDFSQPVALLLVAVLHFIGEDERPTELIRQYRDRLPPGSYLAISHVTDDDPHPAAEKITNLYASSAIPVTLRSRAQIADLFDGWDLVEPGVTWVSEWHPDEAVQGVTDPQSTSVIAAVGRLSAGSGIT